MRLLRCCRFKTPYLIFILKSPILLTTAINEGGCNLKINEDKVFCCKLVTLKATKIKSALVLHLITKPTGLCSPARHPNGTIFINYYYYFFF